jgi:hypothetical protein
VSIRKGEPWGEAATAPADRTVSGTDADLADAVRRHPGTRVRWSPSTGADFARAVNVATTPGTDGAWVLPCDALVVQRSGDETQPEPLHAVNMVILGTPPDRLRRTSRLAPVTVTVDGRRLHSGPATGVVVANGEYLRGVDLVPRGHPGDGRAEVQVYALGPGERRGLRQRLVTGMHLPHPQVRQGAGRRVEIDVSGRAWALEVDGVAFPSLRRVEVTVAPRAFALVT